MGLFANKQTKPQPPSDDDVAADVAGQVFNESFRDELRQAGRDHFMQLIDASAVDLKRDVDAMLQRVSDDLRQQVMKQVEVTVGAANRDIAEQLTERIADYDRTAQDVRDQMSQTLTRNAQAVSDKYQQLSSSLQQSVASQEVLMITALEDNKAHVANAQAEQDKLLANLRETTEAAHTKAEQLEQQLETTISAQAEQLSGVYQENLARVNQTKQAQQQALIQLEQETQTLQQYHQQLTQQLEQTVADHKAMVTATINDNLARIIEHYLVGALGEQSDLVSQLPSIMQRLEESKADMVQDMRL